MIHIIKFLFRLFVSSLYVLVRLMACVLGIVPFNRHPPVQDPFLKEVWG